MAYFTFWTTLGSQERFSILVFGDNSGSWTQGSEPVKPSRSEPLALLWPSTREIRALLHATWRLVGECEFSWPFFFVKRCYMMYIYIIIYTWLCIIVNIYYIYIIIYINIYMCVYVYITYTYIYIYNIYVYVWVGHIAYEWRFGWPQIENNYS